MVDAIRRIFRRKHHEKSEWAKWIESIPCDWKGCIYGPRLAAHGQCPGDNADRQGRCSKFMSLSIGETVEQTRYYEGHR